MVLALMVLWSKCVLSCEWHVSAVSGTDNDDMEAQLCGAIPKLHSCLEVRAVRELGVLLNHLFTALQRDMTIFVDSDESGVRAALVRVHLALWCISAGHQNLRRRRRSGSAVAENQGDTPALVPDDIARFMKIVGN
jgi:hypothetical protein